MSWSCTFNSIYLFLCGHGGFDSSNCLSIIIKCKTVFLKQKNLRTYRKRLIWLMHGYAVHTDLNSVSCRPISWTVCEVQLNGLD